MKFEDLESWQRARQLVNCVYSLTRTPGLEKDFGLCSQIQRAAVSIMSNIAEGFERVHLPEKMQFYNVARGSSAEVRSLLYVIEDNYPAVAKEAAGLRDEAIVVGKLVTGLIQSTASRRSKLLGILPPIFSLLASIFLRR